MDQKSGDADVVNSDALLVIGASSSVGKELIRLLAPRESKIFAHFHHDRAELERLQEEFGARLVLVQADLAEEASVDALVERVSSEALPRKIVFLAAPPLSLTRFKDLSWGDFQNHIDIQVKAAVRILGCFLPAMTTARYGRVVFMLSSYTLGVPPGALAHYVLGKYAVLGLMKALAAEYAGKNICVNAVSPSMITTDYLANIPEKIVELTAQQHPRKKNALPAEIAPVIAFLLSEGAGYLTGANIPVTGGSQF
ncbi:MAG TPA: SDR family oxidoreductase [Candidatus Ozemobacteraceae bacterium]